ncbi:MAG: hypothetical protein EOP38_00035 [Rubrivivax sp.]|nr:MAG: hypothetical protein EOP38_00035 [Rubrivivax sp.]
MATVHTLHPGDVVCAEHGDRLETLLGSCVSVVMTDPRRTVGVMCHIVSQPRKHGSALPATAHYADVALETMYALLRSAGFNPKFCEAHVYGGGNMFPDLVKQLSVGDANARWVLDALAGDGVRVVEQDLGGTAYRRLSWTVGSGLPEVTAVQV